MPEIDSKWTEDLEREFQPGSLTPTVNVPEATYLVKCTDFRVYGENGPNVTFLLEITNGPYAGSIILTDNYGLPHSGNVRAGFTFDPLLQKFHIPKGKVIDQLHAFIDREGVSVVRKTEVQRKGVAEYAMLGTFDPADPAIKAAVMKLQEELEKNVAKALPF